MAIEYINIFFNEFSILSEEKSKKPYCIIYYNGDKIWRVNGLIHREDNPAVLIDKNVLWYLNGIKYSFEEFIEKTPISNEEKIFLRLKYHD